MTFSSHLTCHYSTNRINCKECTKVEKQWEMRTLIEDLEEVKTQKLTKSEICWLRLLIYGLSPEEIAQKLSVTNSYIKSALSTSVYRYVEGMTQRDVNRYSQIRVFLQEEEKYEKVKFEFIIPKDLKPSDIDKELLMYVVRKLGIPFPVEFTVIRIEGNENES